MFAGSVDLKFRTVKVRRALASCYLFLLIFEIATLFGLLLKSWLCGSVTQYFPWLLTVVYIST